MIDPYKVIKKENSPKLNELKSEISYKINYPLFKLQEFVNDPTDIIILGDSRANKLNSDLFERLTEENTLNLAYGGGTLPEIVETFWILTKTHKLKQVYIGINFELFNSLNGRSRVNEANRIRESLASYLTSKYSIKSTFLILKSLLTSKKIEIEKPPFNKEEFWRYQLNTTIPNFYKDYKYPIQFYTHLKEISDYCKQNTIDLIFFIPPTHTELQDKIRYFNLEKENEKFISDLRSLKTTLYDFNFANNLTRNKNNFTDPFHFNDSIAKIVTKIIVGDSLSTKKYSDIYIHFSKTD